MKNTKLTRRSMLCGAGGFVLGGAIASVVGVTYRDEVKKLLGFTRPTTQRLGLVTTQDDGWLLTEEERLAFEEQDELVTSDVLAIRDAVDIPGGDYESFRAGNLQDCVSTCETQSNCQAFTYARASHGVETKRRMCWLKGHSTSNPVSDAAHYVSGRRGDW